MLYQIYLLPITSFQVIMKKNKCPELTVQFSWKHFETTHLCLKSCSYVTLNTKITKAKLCSLSLWSPFHEYAVSKPVCHKHVCQTNEPADHFCLYETHLSFWRHCTALKNTGRDGFPLIYVDWLEIASL